MDSVFNALSQNKKDAAPGSFRLLLRKPTEAFLKKYKIESPSDTLLGAINVARSAEGILFNAERADYLQKNYKKIHDGLVKKKEKFNKEGKFKLYLFYQEEDYGYRKIEEESRYSSLGQEQFPINTAANAAWVISQLYLNEEALAVSPSSYVFGPESAGGYGLNIFHQEAASFFKIAENMFLLSGRDDLAEKIKNLKMPEIPNIKIPKHKDKTCNSLEQLFNTVSNTVQWNASRDLMDMAQYSAAAAASSPCYRDGFDPGSVDKIIYFLNLKETAAAELAKALVSSGNQRSFKTMGRITFKTPVTPSST